MTSGTASLTIPHSAVDGIDDLVTRATHTARLFRMCTCGLSLCSFFFLGDSDLFLDKFVQLYREKALLLVVPQQNAVYVCASSLRGAR